jgi:hypothetical protein
MKILQFVAIVIQFAVSSAHAGWEIHRIPGSDGHTTSRVVLSRHTQPDRGEPTVEAALKSLSSAEVSLVDMIGIHDILFDDEFQKDLKELLVQIAPDAMRAAESSAGNMHNPKMIALHRHFEASVLRTKLVGSVSTSLARHGLAITRVSHEKLSLIDHSGQRRFMCILSLSVGSTAPHLKLVLTDQTAVSAFADFRAELQRRAPAGWVCGEIGTIEGQALFDIRSPKNRFTVVITQHELISQQDWTLRAERMKQAIDSFIAGNAPKEIDDLLVDLPDGWFGATSVCVSLSDPEIHYPEIGTDEQEARTVVNAILGTLKLYDKSGQPGAGQPSTQPVDKPPVKDQPPTSTSKDGPR